MRRLWSAFVLGMVLLVTTPLSAAETPSLDALVQANGNTMASILLLSAPVQADLALTARQQEELQRLRNELLTGVQKLPRGEDLNDLDDATRTQRAQDLKKRQEAAWNSCVAILDDAQRVRLAQIYLHQMKDQALDIPTVMEQLKFTEAQKNKIETLKANFLAKAKAGASVENLSLEERTQRANEAQRRYDERNAAYRAILTPEQAAAFTAMKGKPYEVSERLTIRNDPSNLFRLDVSLVTQQEIQKELDFTAEQTQKLAEVAEEHLQAIRAGAPVPEARAANVGPQRPLTSTQRYFDSLRKLLTEKQVQRLTELTLQKRGPSMLQEPDISEKLKLTEEQRKQLQQVDSRLREMRMERQEARRQAMKDNDLAKMNRLMAEDRQLNAKRDADYLKVLTEEQKAAFEAMQGKKFTFPDPAARLRQLNGSEKKNEST